MKMNIIYLFCCLWMTLGECSEEKLHSVLYCNQSRTEDLIEPKDLKDPGQEFVHLFIKFILPQDADQQLVDKQQSRLHRFLCSIFSESKGTPINFIFLTDLRSKDFLDGTFRKAIGMILNRKLFYNKQRNESNSSSWVFPRFVVQYVSYHFFQHKYRKELDEFTSILCSKNYYSIPVVDVQFWSDLNSDVPDIEEITNKNNNTIYYKCEERYAMDFMYVNFLLVHELPPFIKKLILLDTDLRLRIDIGQLFDIFNQMTSKEIFALGKDLNESHEVSAWRYLHENPLATLGKIGQFQALNGGVILMNVERLRAQPDLVSAKHIAQLKEEFKYAPHTDQGAFHLLQYKHPKLVYVLPCQYNLLVKRAEYDYQSNILSYNTCLTKPLIEHHTGYNPFIYILRYNDVLKLSAWCWNPSWQHCY